MYTIKTIKLLTIICAFLLSFDFLNAQIDIKGTWEYDKTDLQKQPEVDYYVEFSFWMKFSDEKVMMCNTNNRQTFNLGGIWSYNIGIWHQNNDTLFVEIIEKGIISANTGFTHIDTSENNEIKIIRFLIKERKDGKIEMVALDRFLFTIPTIPEDSKDKRFETVVVGLKEGERFVMNKVTQVFYGATKI